ncbi:hypothetical protein TRIUR3_15653 [Triticum urartu]|uniref:Uncharacterized protein n=1 Tax=Triticum urartu TaxID=4572 RepID=M7YSI7_TRIUA|nr:hypothetical protein TRIUR3_15653 [Triticum urartu]
MEVFGCRGGGPGFGGGNFSQGAVRAWTWQIEGFRIQLESDGGLGALEATRRSSLAIAIDHDEGVGMRGGGGAGDKQPANGMHGGAGGASAGKPRSYFLYGILLYAVLPVLFLYMVVAAISPIYNPRCSPEGAGAMVHFVVANPNASSSNTSMRPPMVSADDAPTGLRHIVFGIGASSALWESRKEYIKLWWRPGRMRGFVWMDKPVEEFYSKSSRTGLPAIMVSSDTSKFPYTHGAGRAANLPHRLRELPPGPPGGPVVRDGRRRHGVPPGEPGARAVPPCQKPNVYYMRDSRMDRRRNVTVTEYERHRVKPPPCRWRIADPAALLDHIVVLKKPDPDLWKRSPRRNCCKVLSSPKKGENRSMTINVGVCREGEFAKI